MENIEVHSQVQKSYKYSKKVYLEAKSQLKKLAIEQKNHRISMRKIGGDGIANSARDRNRAKIRLLHIRYDDIRGKESRFKKEFARLNPMQVVMYNRMFPDAVKSI